jgi:hypothetical protein
LKRRRRGGKEPGTGNRVTGEKGKKKNEKKKKTRQY